MKIYLILIVYFINITSILAQQNTVINYRVKLLDGEFQKNKSPKNQEVNNQINELLNQSKDFLNLIEFVLKIKDNEAIFTVGQSFSTNDEAIGKFAYSLILAEGVTYVNAKTREVLYQMEAYGSQILLLSSLDEQEWKIDNKSKTISGFTCYKAESTIDNSNIIAWFAPKIALPFGPAGYGGLPGLILELEVSNGFSPHIYYLEKIDVNPSEKFVINKPIKGKLVNKDELEQMGEKAHENFKKMGN